MRKLLAGFIPDNQKKILFSMYIRESSARSLVEICEKLNASKSEIIDHFAMLETSTLIRAFKDCSGFLENDKKLTVPIRIKTSTKNKFTIVAKELACPIGDLLDSLITSSRNEIRIRKSSANKTRKRVRK